MKHPIRIETASLDDIEQLLEIEKRVFSHFDGLLTRRTFRRHIDSKHLFLVARNRPGGVITGYILVFVFRCSARIYSLAVHPEFQGIGIGKKLLESALKRLAAPDRKQIRLEVRQKNRSARALYESFGFQIRGIRPNYYGRHENGICMVYSSA